MSIQKSRAGPEFSVFTVDTLTAVEHHLVLRAFALYWEILLLWLFAGIFLLVQARHDITDVYFTFFIQHGPLYTMFVTFLVAVLSEFLVRCLVFFLTARLPEVSMYVTRRSQLSFLESEMVRVETHAGPCWEIPSQVRVELSQV